MGEVMSATVPIFAIVALGFLVTRARLLRRADMSVLATYVVHVALPALVFVSVYGRSVGEVLHPTYLLTYAVAAVTMMGLGRAWAASRRSSPTAAATLALAVSGTNNGFIGLPVFLLVLPHVAGVAVGMAMMVDSLVLLPAILGMYEAAAGAGSDTDRVRRFGGVLRRVLAHPMVLAIALAMLLGVLGVHLPDVVLRPVELVGQSASAVALFAIGGMLVGLRLGRGRAADLAAAVVGKLLVMPLVGVGLVSALPLLGLPELTGDLRAAAVLLCALPSMSSMAAIAEEYGQGELGAAAMMLSTMVSFATLSGWLLALQALGWL